MSAAHTPGPTRYWMVAKDHPRKRDGAILGYVDREGEGWRLSRPWIADDSCAIHATPEAAIRRFEHVELTPEWPALLDPCPSCCTKPSEHALGPWYPVQTWTTGRNKKLTWAAWRDTGCGTTEMRSPNGRALRFRSEAHAKAAILHRMQADHTTGSTS